MRYTLCEIYAVYYQGEHRRWAGYAVPAVCDAPGCYSRITRGLGYAHQELISTGDVELGFDLEHCVCGMFFCKDHEYFYPCVDITPKGDTLEWLDWIITDQSWEQWRVSEPLEYQATLTKIYGKV